MEDIKRQFQNLPNNNGYHFEIENTAKFNVIGNLSFSIKDNSIIINDKYHLKFVFNDDNPIPLIYELDNKIDKKYHQYPNGSLCLTLDFQIEKILKDDKSISNIIEKLLLPYLYRHSYLKEYNTTPWGEYSHHYLIACTEAFKDQIINKNELLDKFKKYKQKPNNIKGINTNIKNIINYQLLELFFKERLKNTKKKKKLNYCRVMKKTIKMNDKFKKEFEKWFKKKINDNK